MQVQISGKQIDIGTSLQEHVRERLEKSVNKYFDKAITASVVFAKEAHLFSANVIVNEGTGVGVMLKSDSKSDDIYHAFDNALIKMEKQLRRYKRKIKNHHKAKPATLFNEFIEGKKYVITPFNAEERSEEHDDTPIIIAEKATSIEQLSVSEAVMKMDLSQLPALLFINRANGRLNVVYHRADGNISWVDPEK